jgi:receptor protein-tyrosine kinase
LSWSTDEDFWSGQEWGTTECLRTLYRRKLTLAWITGIGILAASLISAFQPRLYQSQASLEIQVVNENFLNLRDIYPAVTPSADASGTYVQTQAEILQEDALIEQVVRKLRLEKPGFNGGFSFWNKFAGAANTSPVEAESNTVAMVKKNLRIVPSRGSRIVRIFCDARDPQLAAELANTLAQTFIEQSIDARERSAQQTHESLSLQLDQLKDKFLRSEAALGEYDRTSQALFSSGHHSRTDFGSSLSAVLTRTHYNALKREVDTNRKNYEAMSQRVNDAAVAAAIRQSNIRLISSAQPPVHPYKPNVPLNLAIGTFGGLLLAVSCVMLQEQSNSVLRMPGEAGVCLTLPELGAIPAAVNGGVTALRLLSSNRGKLGVDRPAALEEQFSGLSESFRTTLVSILSAGHNGEHPHALVVTSARPMEGKTTIVSNLGIALAQISGKVLLIDGDMRRPRLHIVFDQANSWGLSDVLREKNAIEELPLDALVKKTAIPHLYLLPSGACADNTFSLLCSGRMARLLPRFRQEFDYVLVDAPPCLEFADARIMARYVEKLLLVVRANYTDRRTAQVAVQRLLLDGLSVMGVILNRWDSARSDIYGSANSAGLNREGRS